MHRKIAGEIGDKSKGKIDKKRGVESGAYLTQKAVENWGEKRGAKAEGITPLPCTGNGSGEKIKEGDTVTLFYRYVLSHEKHDRSCEHTKNKSTNEDRTNDLYADGGTLIFLFISVHLYSP